jgi:glutamate-1-semialdehyde 2,1-aminomutase
MGSCDRPGVLPSEFARGGVQELMGVEADISTFAKAMGNGYQIAAVGGREDIMRKYGQGIAHGGTYTAHSVALAAAEKTLEILDETPALETIATFGGKLRDGMSRILDERDIVHSFVGHPSTTGLFFAEKTPTNDRDWKTSDYTFYDTMARHLHDEDSREPWFICEAHDQTCLDDTLAAFEKAVDKTVAQLAGNEPRRATGLNEPEA